MDESLILKLLRKILQFEATFSLIEDSNNILKGVILIVGGEKNITRQIKMNITVNRTLNKLYKLILDVYSTLCQRGTNVTSVTAVAKK